MGKYFVEESSINCNKEGQPLWAVKKWLGNKAEELCVFDTENEADNSLFYTVYLLLFMEDDQRDTRYWLTREEAEIALNEME
jgi:hypothetical protein